MTRDDEPHKHEAAKVARGGEWGIVLRHQGGEHGWVGAAGDWYRWDCARCRQTDGGFATQDVALKAFRQHEAQRHP